MDVNQTERSISELGPRDSSGLLLRSVSPTESEDSPHIKDSPPSEVARGKRKVTNGSLVVPKSKGNRRPVHQRQHSLGSSPLATEIVNVKPEEEDAFASARGVSNSTNTGSVGSSTGSQKARQNHDDREGANTNQRRSAIGFDTDPSQIVNLALNLSESRRRNFSSGGFLLGRESPPSKRLSSYGQSYGQPQLGLPYSTSGGSLRQHLQQQRQSHRHSSARSNKSSHGRAAVSPGLQSDTQDKRTASTLVPDLRSDVVDNALFKASDATLARVQKAKEAFELSYEYRRLLKQLPELPSPSSSRPATGRKGRDREQDDQLLGRGYNPLQYVRNRRIRLRERKPLRAEADGWKDVNKVRDWVNNVESERQHAHVDGGISLPPFDAPGAGSSILDGIQAPSIAQSKLKAADNPGRPHNDWTFMPWDLLADAYWLHQGDNFKRIEDHSGNKMLDCLRRPDVVSPRTSKEYARKTRTSTSIPRGDTSPERPQNLAKTSHPAQKQQIRRGQKPLDAGSLLEDRGRKGRWTKGFIRSREPSTSDDSDDGISRRIKDRDRPERDRLDNIALEKQMMDLLAKEEDDNRQSLTDAEAAHHTRKESSTSDGPQPNGSPIEQRKQLPKAPQRLKTDSPVKQRASLSPKTSFDGHRFNHQRMSSDDLDLTRPNSPTVAGFIPSIAINLSPSTSPRATAASPEKSPTAISDASQQHKRSDSKPAVSEHDFGTESRASLELTRPSTSEEPPSDAGNLARLTDSAKNFLSPTKSRTLGHKHRVNDSRSFRNLKDQSEPESRLRGILKGGRLAEIVGSQVSRAGDMLWRKDGANNALAGASPTSDHGSTDSDVDDADISALESSPNDLSRVTTSNDDMDRTKRPSTALERKPKYFMSNLPSFRSPNERKDSLAQSPNSSPVLDPISRQQRVQKERTRSSRFDRLAPPRIDMRGVSPSASPTASRAQSPTAGEEEASRASSVDDFRSRVSSHGRLNDMLGIPGKVGTVIKGPTPTGLSKFEAQPQQGRPRPNLEGKRQWSISDRGMAATSGTITKRDIARVRALLLSSGIKASEIARRADEVPDQPSKLLQGIEDAIDEPLPRAAPAQEHVVAARLLVRAVENTNNQLQDAESRFTSVTVKDLSGRIHTIGKRINASLSPLVRDSADDADAFSAELTTTHTLSVKQLNDRVDLILRRRRRRSRLIRRSGWAVLEWTVLGIMWMVWFIVVIVRLIRGTVTGSVRAVKWLFWL